jgi:hypothetical protein
MDVDSLGDHIPYYLTREQKEGLIRELKHFNSRPIAYYINGFPVEVLQGDGWSGFEVLRFEGGERRRVRGIVLSNTCDIAAGNIRDFPPRIVFAPIVKLDNYARWLQEGGFLRQVVEDKLRAIREQRVTSIFYLPGNGTLDAEYIARLDDLHSVPYSAFDLAEGRRKLFTLSMVGFYLFLFKLSVHFCRFHEEVVR